MGLILYVLSILRINIAQSLECELTHFTFFVSFSCFTVIAKVIISLGNTAGCKHTFMVGRMTMRHGGDCRIFISVITVKEASCL